MGTMDTITGTDLEHDAAAVLHSATVEAAKERGTIASVSDRITTVTQNLMGENESPEWSSTVSGSSAVESIAPTYSVTEVSDRAKELHDIRMVRYEANTDIHITVTDAGGYFDGKNPYVASNVVENASDAFNVDVTLHETRHEEDGLPDNLDGQFISDEQLAEGIRAELKVQVYETVRESPVALDAIPENLSSDRYLHAVAEKVVHVTEENSQTNRDFAERSAMDAENRDPAANSVYFGQHYQPTEAMHSRVEAAGGNFEDAFRKAVGRQKDKSAMIRELSRAALREAGLTPSVN